MKSRKQDTGKSRELEDLRAENRRLKKVIRQLQKSAHIYNNIKDLVQEIPQEKEDAKLICDSCGKGEVVILDLGARKVLSCSLCEHREVLKDGSKKETS